MPPNWDYVDRLLMYAFNAKDSYVKFIANRCTSISVLSVWDSHFEARKWAGDSSKDKVVNNGLIPETMWQASWSMHQPQVTVKGLNCILMDMNFLADCQRHLKIGLAQSCRVIFYSTGLLVFQWNHNRLTLLTGPRYFMWTWEIMPTEWPWAW